MLGMKLMDPSKEDLCKEKLRWPSYRFLDYISFILKLPYLVTKRKNLYSTMLMYFYCKFG